jgi:serine/threonine protein phosphatase 1
MNKCIYACGDIHGRFDCLIELKKKILNDSEKYDEKTIIYLGDYVDRGPNSAGVIDEFIKNPLHGFEEIYLRGNHEDFMINALNGKADWDAVKSWLYHGGVKTLKSYNIDVPSLIGRYQDMVMEYNGFNMGLAEKVMPKLHNELLQNVPKEHIKFYENLKLYHREQGYVFVHAGIDPDLTFEEQTEHQMLWIRQKFLQSDMNFGFKVVHGHTPGPVPINRHNRIGIDTCAFDTGVLTAVALTDNNEYFIDTKLM